MDIIVSQMLLYKCGCWFPKYFYMTSDKRNMNASIFSQQFSGYVASLMFGVQNVKGQE